MNAKPIPKETNEDARACEIWENEGGSCLGADFDNSHPGGEIRIPIRAVNKEPHREGEVIPGANKPTTFDEVRDRIRMNKSDLRRIRVPISSIRVNGNQIIIDDEQLGLEEEGLRSLCGDIGAPYGYISQLGREIRNLNLEFGLKATGQRKSGITDGNSVILVRNGKFRGLDRDDLYTLSGTEVIGALEEGLGRERSGFRVENFALCDEALTLDVVSERIAAEVRAGDVLQAGIHLEHSLVGDTATTIKAYVLRLLCRNGLTHRECVGTRKTQRTRRLPSNRDGAAEHQHGQIKGLVEQTCRLLEGKLQAIRNLGNERFHGISEVDRTFEQFLRRGRMYSQNLMRLLRRAWTEELGGNRELTYFGVLNALTWLATHSANLTDDNQRTSVRQRVALASLAGIFANQRVHICPVCFSVVSGSGERLNRIEGEGSMQIEHDSAAHSNSN